MAQNPAPNQPRQSTALAQRSSELLQEAAKLVPSEAVTTVPQLQAALNTFHKAAAEGKLHMLSPVVVVDSLMPMSKVSFHIATLDITVDAKGNGVDVYRNPQFCDPGEVALTKNAIDKLQNAAGVEMGVPGTGQQGIVRLDDRQTAYYWEYEVTMSLVDFDGTRRVASATKIVDLRDGAPATQKPEWVCKEHNDARCQKCGSGDGRWKKSGKLASMDETALAQMRIHGGSNCETKARLRCLRTLLRILQKYTLQQAAMPFVYPKLVSDLDINDPDTKRAILAAHLGFGQQFFGPQPSDGPPALGIGAPGTQPGRSTSDSGGEHQTTEQSGSDGTIDITATHVEEEEGSGSSGSSADDDDSWLTAKPAEAKTDPILCGCTCSHQAEVPADQAKNTAEKSGGSIRCDACWPGSPRFDFSKHDQDLSLGLKNKPELTPRLLRQLRAPK